MEFFSVTSVFLLALLCYALWKSKMQDRHNRRWFRSPPGPSVWSFLKNGKLVKENPSRFLVAIGKKYSGFYCLSNYVTNFLVINDWKIMKEALNVPSFLARPDMFVANKMLERKDILFIDGPLWAEKRRFTLHHLRNLGFGKTSMESVILYEISAFFEHTLEPHSNRGPVIVNNLFFSPVMNVIWGLLAGRRYDSEDGHMQEFCATIKRVFEMFNECIHLNFFPQLRFVVGTGRLGELLALSGTVKSFLGQEIDQNRASLDNSDPRCFFDFYLNEIIREESRRGTAKKENCRDCYTKDDLIGISFDLLQAGIETTVSTLEWTLLYMALWPEIQAEAQEELDRVVGRQRLPVFADHASLPFLEATIMEIHRFSSVIPLSGPRSATAATELAGYVIQKDTVIISNIWAVHNDENLWGDPEVFRPRRFINADGKVEPPEYLIPFSTGSRKCLGQSLVRIEVFLFIACLLQRFSFNYLTGVPPPTLTATPSVTRSPQPFSLIVKHRPPLFY